jgi:hypothetical protein
MAWDWTSQTLDPVALVRVSYREGGDVRYARWSGPQGRAGSGVNWYDPDGLTADVQHWEARLLGGMQIEESLGAIDKPELSIGSLSLRVRCPASSEDGSSNALRRSILEDRWERGDVVVWLLDRDSLETREVYRGRAPWGPSPIDDEQFTLQTEALPFDLPDLRVPHTRIPSNTDGYAVFAGFPYSSTFLTPAVYQINEENRDKCVGPVIGNPINNTAYGWVRVVPFGYRALGAPAGDFVFHCHVSQLLGVVAFDAVVETDNGSTYISNSNSPSNDYIKPYENAIAAYGPLGSSVEIQVPAAENPSADWITEGRSFMVRCYGYGAGQLDATRPPYYDYSVNAAGRLSLPSTAGLVDRYDEVLTDVLEGADWANITNAYGVGSVAALYAAAPISTTSFDHVVTALDDAPSEEPAHTRDLLAGMCLGLGFDLCPRVDPSDGVIRLFPLWRQPQSTSQTPDWTLDESDLQKQSPPRGIKLARDPDRVYGNRVSVKGQRRNPPPVDGLEDDAQQRQQDARTYEITDEVTALGRRVDATVSIERWQPQPDVAGETPSGFAAIAGFRIARDVARPQPVIVAAGGFPLARVQLGDVVVWDIEGYPDAPGQVRSRSIDLATGKVTLRSHHALAWDIFGEGD